MKLTGLLLLLVAANLSGQPQLTFEVASIKPSPPVTPASIRSGTVHAGTKIDNARADFGNASLIGLIARAYDVRTFQIQGPDWMNTCFDILAKLPDGASADQVPEMLRALLADRFRLTIHRDSKEFAVYALLVGKDGSKLATSPADYDPAPTNNVRPMPMEALAIWLSSAVDKPVVDQTGMKGDYKVDMTGILKEIMQTGMAHLKQQTGAVDAAEPTGSSIPALLQAMGLRLEARKLPLPLIVVDRLEKLPTEN
jgi:uncharacterized protein (TIGR03435 family)